MAQLEEGGDVTAVSPLYETEPVGGPEDQGAFLNIVVELATADSPRQLLPAARRWKRPPTGSARSVSAPAPSMRTSCWWATWWWTSPIWSCPIPACGSAGSCSQPLADLAPDLVPADRLIAAGGKVVRTGSL